VSGLPGLVLNRLLCCLCNDLLVCDLLTFTGDVSRAGADDVVEFQCYPGLSRWCPCIRYLAFDQCVEYTLCHPLRQCNVMALLA
jgi:hypothetical protein